MNIGAPLLSGGARSVSHYRVSERGELAVEVGGRG